MDDDITLKAMEQLKEAQRVLDYDTKEFTIELLVQKFRDGDRGDIFVPAYQRRFSWGIRRQSRLIESLLMGLPIPFLFFGDMPDGRYEVVDGQQRLATCRAFLNGTLELEDLDRLDLLNGFRFEQLSLPQQRRFKNRTIRSVVLSENASQEDRRDLFDRINTGSLIAKPAEIRRGTNSGPITELIEQLAEDELFMRLCPLTIHARNKRGADELITRFLTFADGTDGYRDRMAEYQDRWLRQANKAAEVDAMVVDAYKNQFHRTMVFVDNYFPHGFAKKAGSRSTPRVRFDAIAIGVWMALQEDPSLAESGPATDVKEWLDDDSFGLLTASGAANVRSKIQNRTEFVQLMLLGKHEEATERGF